MKNQSLIKSLKSFLLHKMLIAKLTQDQETHSSPFERGIFPIVLYLMSLI